MTDSTVSVTLFSHTSARPATSVTYNLATLEAAALSSAHKGDKLDPDDVFAGVWRDPVLTVLQLRLIEEFGVVDEDEPGGEHILLTLTARGRQVYDLLVP